MFSSEIFMALFIILICHSIHAVKSKSLLYKIWIVTMFPNPLFFFHLYAIDKNINLIVSFKLHDI